VVWWTDGGCSGIVGSHGRVGTREDVWYVLVFVVVPAQDHCDVEDVEVPKSSLGQILNSGAFRFANVGSDWFDPENDLRRGSLVGAVLLSTRFQVLDWEGTWW
jgi:hypothetical protein